MTPEERTTLLIQPSGHVCKTCGRDVQRSQYVGGGGNCRACNFQTRLKRVPR